MPGYLERLIELTEVNMGLDIIPPALGDKIFSIAKKRGFRANLNIESSIISMSFGHEKVRGLGLVYARGEWTFNLPKSELEANDQMASALIDLSQLYGKIINLLEE